MVQKKKCEARIYLPGFCPQPFRFKKQNWFAFVEKEVKQHKPAKYFSPKPHDIM